MKSKFFVLTVLILMLLLLPGCRTALQSGAGNQLSATGETPELAPLEPLGTPSAGPAISPSPSAAKPTSAPMEADWVIQVDDTQDYINKESGLLYHCNLYIYAQKAGGTTVLGNYSAQIVLKMEPDLQQLSDMIGEDGLIVDSISGGSLRLEAVGAEFEMVAYSAKDYAAKMKEIAPDQQLLQMTDPNATENAMALELINMKLFYDSAEASGHDTDGNTGAGWGVNAEAETEKPVVLLVEGATVYVSFPQNGFDRAFKGTIVGNVR